MVGSGLMNRKKIIWLSLALVFIVSIGFKVWQKIDQNQKTLTGQNGRGNQPMISVPLVQVIRVKPEPIRETIRLMGNIEAEEEVAIQPRISGRLNSLLVEEGQAVRKGELIGEMDDESIRLQLQQSEANIANMKAAVKQAELNLKKQQTEKERYQELLKHRYISQREYENVENSFLTAQAAWEGLNAQLLSQEKNYELLKLQLSQTKLYSPIHGYILRKLAAPGTNLTTGTTVVIMADLDPVKLVFNIDQKEAAKIGKGNEVNFITDAIPGRIFQGKIKQLAPVYDTQTRTLNLAASISNSNRILVPGMFGTAEIIMGSKSQALVVPQDAVVRFQDRAGVFRVDLQKIAHFQPVETGLITEGKVEIRSGIREGDLVVVVGQNRLRDQQPVQILGEGDGSNLGESRKGDMPRNGKSKDTARKKAGNDR